MQHRTRTIGVAAVGLLLLVGLTGAVVPAQQGAAEENRMVIEEFQMAQNRSFADAVAEATTLVQKMRATGEYKSVKLYMHEWGSEAAVYIVQEPKSWASIQKGWAKLVAANPSIMTDPYKWGRHTDQILSEVPVP